MTQRWIVRWRYRDGDVGTRYGEASFGAWTAACRMVSRVVESDRDLEWVTGPTAVQS